MMRRILTVAAAVLALGAPARASGLRTPFGEVIVRGLKIGQTYSMYKLVNLPLRVVNTGSESVDLRIAPVMTSSAEAKAGYTPIPSLDWIRVERGTFTVAPNREAVTDVIITVPNDPALLGRRFEADIWTHTTNARALLVGLRSKLLLHIDSTPPTEDELKKKFVDERLANLDFTVLPNSAQVSDLPLGRAVDLRKEHKVVIKLINPNDRPIDFRVRSIPVWESLITAPEGYEAAYNPQWLKPEKDVVKVDGNSIGDTSLTIDIPDDPRYRGKHFFFIASFEVLEQKIPTRVYFRLLVDTPAAPKTGAAGGK